MLQTFLLHEAPKDAAARQWEPSLPTASNPSDPEYPDDTDPVQNEFEPIPKAASYDMDPEVMLKALVKQFFQMSLTEQQDFIKTASELLPSNVMKKLMHQIKREQGERAREEDTDVEWKEKRRQAYEQFEKKLKKQAQDFDLKQRNTIHIAIECHGSDLETIRPNRKVRMMYTSLPFRTTSANTTDPLFDLLIKEYGAKKPTDLIIKNFIDTCNSSSYQKDKFDAIYDYLISQGETNLESDSSIESFFMIRLEDRLSDEFLVPKNKTIIVADEILEDVEEMKTYNVGLDSSALIEKYKTFLTRLGFTELTNGFFVISGKELKKAYVTVLKNNLKYYKSQTCYEAGNLVNRSYEFTTGKDIAIKQFSHNSFDMPFNGGIKILKCRYNTELYQDTVDDLLSSEKIITDSPVHALLEHVRTTLRSKCARHLDSVQKVSYLLTLNDIINELNDHFVQIYIYDLSCRTSHDKTNRFRESTRLDLYTREKDSVKLLERSAYSVFGKKSKQKRSTLRTKSKARTRHSRKK